MIFRGLCGALARRCRLNFTKFTKFRTCPYLAILSKPKLRCPAESDHNAETQTKADNVKPEWITRTQQDRNLEVVEWPARKKPRWIDVNGYVGWRWKPSTFQKTPTSGKPISAPMNANSESPFTSTMAPISPIHRERNTKPIWRDEQPWSKNPGFGTQARRF